MPAKQFPTLSTRIGPSEKIYFPRYRFSEIQHKYKINMKDDEADIARKFKISHRPEGCFWKALGSQEVFKLSQNFRQTFEYYTTSGSK